MFAVPSIDLTCRGCTFVYAFNARMACARYSASPPAYCDDPGVETATPESLLLYFNDKDDRVSVSIIQGVFKNK